MYKNNIKKLKAFTLIEVLISLFVFIIIAGILTKIYITTIRTERIAYVLLRDENIVRNELETLARDIRMGVAFELNSQGDSLDYKTYYNNSWHRIVYKHDKEKFTIQKSVSDDHNYASNEYLTVVPENIKIDKLNFWINQGVNEQLSITIALTVVSSVYGREYVTQLQTTITPRMSGL